MYATKDIVVLTSVPIRCETIELCCGIGTKHNNHIIIVAVKVRIKLKG